MKALQAIGKVTNGARGRKLLGVAHTREIVEEIFIESLHAKRVESLANGVAGALNASMASVRAIGRAYADLQGIQVKSGVKQIDRLLSNTGVDLDETLGAWARFVAGDAEKLVLAMDWTDFEPDDHTTLCIYPVTRHGRAMPFVWQTVKKSKLKGHQTEHEMAMIERLHGYLPKHIEVTLLADRGFGKVELYDLLELLGWDYVIRFRGAIRVGASEGESAPANDLVPKNGRARMLTSATVTGKKSPVPAVVLVKKAGMKDSWCLATSLASASPQEVIKLYSKRFTIEEAFRDTKDLHFGLGLSSTHIRDAGRRDRLLLLIAIAHSLLTLLGAAGERCGLDASLKTNTVKTRTLSLINQGLCWYSAMPNMPEQRLRILLEAYEQLVTEQRFFCEIFALN